MLISSIRRDVETTGAAGIALLVLFFGIVTNRYRFDAIPFRPHPEHIAILVALSIFAWLLVQKRTPITWQKSDLLLAAYLGIALVSSVLFPPEPRESIQYWARMVLAVAVYFVARWLVRGKMQTAAFRLALKATLVFGVLEAGFGIASWFLYPLGINLGVDEYPLGIRGPGGVVCNFSLTTYGTLWEPNVFGSTLMLVILVAAALFISNDFIAWRKWLGAALCVMLIALAFNASRAAFATLAFGVVLILVFVRGMALREKIKWTSAGIVLLLAVNVTSQELPRVLMQLPTAPGLAARAPCAEWIAAGMPRVVEDDPEYNPTGPESSSNVLNRILEGQTLSARMISYQHAWADFLARPWLGNGANAFAQKYTTTAHTPGWISNLFLMSLHDTGIVGTVILAGWLVWFAAWILVTLRQARPGALRTMVLASAIGTSCLFVAYQATTMLWFGFVWWYLAVLEGGANGLCKGVTELQARRTG